ncbi:MAG: Rieske 2Fe-2S domain-containing protein, partial [Thaumarchaeota archaeon]|nr:Rieske 2Fe-2S domain-containing protein [Nitrososphaerota archaeon]
MKLPPSQQQQTSQIYCPCHGSVFDVTGRVLRGPPALPPSIKLTVDSAGLVWSTQRPSKGRGPASLS